MKFEIFNLENEFEIEPATSDRGWMDELPQRYGYRCLPLTLANSCGWVIKAPFDVRIQWNGGKEIKDLSVISEKPMAETKRFATTHFGAGIVTFHTGILIRTPPNFQIYVSGPPNLSKHGLSALAAIVPTDWMPAPFTMNWKMTAPGTVTFRKGDPFCFFSLVQPVINIEAEPILRDLKDAPDLAAAYKEWCESRGEFLTNLSAGCPITKEQGWQKSLITAAARSGVNVGQGVTRIRLKKPRNSSTNTNLIGEETL